MPDADTAVTRSLNGIPLYECVSCGCIYQDIVSECDCMAGHSFAYNQLYAIRQHPITEDILLTTAEAEKALDEVFSMGDESLGSMSAVATAPPSPTNTSEICVVDKEQLRSRLIDAYRSFPEDSEYVASKRIDLMLEEIRPYLRTTEPVASDLRDAANECSHQLREAICHMTDAWRKEGFEGKSILAEMEHAISQVRNALAAPEPVATGKISVVKFPSTSQFHNFAPFEAAGLEVMKQCSRYESKQVESINGVVEAALDVYRKQCEEVTQPEPVVRSEEVGSGLRAVMYRDGVQCANQPEAMKEFIMGVVGMEYVD